MLKRVVVFETACFLALRNGQLIRTVKGVEGEQVIPIEDIAVVIVEDGAVVITVRVMQEMLRYGVAVVFCDLTHHPTGMLLSLDGHTTHAEVLRRQLGASDGLKRRLWQQIVRSKLLNQAALLRCRGGDGVEALGRLASRVRAGDRDNREAVAARLYWKRLFVGQAFKRDRDGPEPNPLLNYGYAILRAATARALVGSGLYCAIGLHHHNRYNAFCLADDIMEPYRPFVDREVFRLVDEQGVEGGLSRLAKERLLRVLTLDVGMGELKRPLMNALSLTSASLVRCLAGEDRALVLPGLS